MEANKSTVKQFFGKASGTKERDPLYENCFATDTYTLFLLQDRCFSRVKIFYDLLLRSDRRERAAT